MPHYRYISTATPPKPLLAPPRKSIGHVFAKGTPVRFTYEDVPMVGVIAKYATDGNAIVRLAIPNEAGLLMVSDAEVALPSEDLSSCDAPWVERKVMSFQTNEAFSEDGVKAVVVREPGTQRLLDYQDVMFQGYGSTFAHITPKDRDGDAVLSGAFTDTLREFRRNPVMLIDHRNSVWNIAGSYVKVEQDEIGLAVTGKVSNAPDLQRIRFLIMEGHLRTLSMGGIFLFGMDGKTIEKVYLFEISLVAVPANPDALFQARALDLDSAAKMFRRQAGKAAFLAPN